MTLLVRNKAGHAVTLDVEAILNIDGQPFKTPEASEDFVTALHYLDGRVSAIEGILGLRLESVTELQPQEN